MLVFCIVQISKTFQQNNEIYFVPDLSILHLMEDEFAGTGSLYLLEYLTSLQISYFTFKLLLVILFFFRYKD